MSEYQYYEFLALDRRLTDEQMRDLRAISSRAEITPTSFVNVYNYGDFKGDEYEFLTRYFDAHVYVANWGTRRFMVRLPKDAIDVEVAVRKKETAWFEARLSDLLDRYSTRPALVGRVERAKLR